MENNKKNLLPNPRDQANFLSVLTFWWTIDLFRKGYSKILDITDISQPRRDDFATLLGNRLESKWKIQTQSANPSLITALFTTFWREFTLLGFITVINQFGAGILQPILLGKLLLYFRNGSNITYEEALYYGSGLVACTAIFIFSYNQFVITTFHISMKIRIAVCAIIYRKSLKLSRTALGVTAPGKIVNLLSNDVNRFDNVVFFLHSMWIAPLVTLTACLLLWHESGGTAMIGIIVILLFVPMQSYAGKLSSKFRLQTALKTDERIRFMDEIISGAQVIKMYAWEKPFSLLIQMARKLELKIVIKSSYLRGLYMTFMMLTTRLAIFCTMITIILTDQLTASKVFVIVAYFNIISTQMTQMFVRGVAEIAEILVAIKRLKSFMELDEKLQNTSVKRNSSGKHDERPLEAMNPAISFKNASARWISKSNDDNSQSLTLQNINIDFKQGSLIGIVGSVGSGKSSLLQTILKELPLESGTIIINGRLSYACQEPWIFAGSIKQNITFGLKMDKSRYNEVTKSCALLQDFKQFPYGDKSIIGERGSSLSGGQKARINLARALYREADIYLFDDPLSAVDAHVGLHLFDNVIGPKSHLAKTKRTRILITHQVHYLKNADSIIVLKDGRIQFYGTPRELVRSGIDIAELVNTNEMESIETDNSDVITVRRNSSQKSINSYDKEMLNLGRSNSVNSINVANLETTSKGIVKGSPLWNYFKCGGNPFALLALFILFIMAQIFASFSDWWMSFFTAQEELRHYYDTFPNTSANNISAQSHADTLISTNTCMYVHGFLIFGLLIIALSRSAKFYSTCVRASQVLHDGMFKGIIHTAMRFFDLNPSGRVLNRFSNDMGLIDEFLPKALLDSTQNFLAIAGTILITITINPVFIVPILVLILLCYLIRKIYLKTSKNLKRVESITRSPVFSHLAATISGLSTIRASDAQTILIAEFHAHQDLHTGAAFMFLNASIAFGFSLDLLCLVFISIVTFSFLLFDTTAFGDKVGLAITQALTLPNIMQWAARQSAEVTNFMMSVERLLEYRDLAPELQPLNLTVTADEWPLHGQLEFKNVTFRYFEDAEPVLRGLSFVIIPREKIGIVGRTGAGKSSLIGALFRLALVEGEIFIDNVETSKLTLQLLRSKISIIPQDPVLFSGTLRRNLDPLDIYSDIEIWDALEQVDLKEVFNVSGLDGVVLAGGCNYSVGQRQLICLARAILRKNKILILDEATANVDPQTDLLIQQTIRKRFTDCTILTVAHRLHTIMDSDRVLVMNFGKADEFAAPYELLMKSHSIFKQMIEATGIQESERLTRMAYLSYSHKN